MWFEYYCFFRICQFVFHEGGVQSCQPILVIKSKSLLFLVLALTPIIACPSGISYVIHFVLMNELDLPDQFSSTAYSPEEEIKRNPTIPIFLSTAMAIFLIFGL